MIPGLFKSEFSRIVSAIARQLGMEHLAAAEDIASETFLAAMETWPYKGEPSNPTGWLYTVAKNKALNYINRHRNFRYRVATNVRPTNETDPDITFDMSTGSISDSQLQMLFALCHPAIPVEAQIGLSLRILCGFGIDEIANAFLTNRETINKRLFRAREKLREEKVEIEFPGDQEVARRLDTVITTLYLLFNEGYYSESHDGVLREDLCMEAMRLTYMLTEHERTNRPEVNALLALMCFHASRFEARKRNHGITLYDDQDESEWDYQLIAKGIERLHLSSQGDQVTKYHLEANIAYWHTIKNDSPEKWNNILRLYNHLLVVDYSPIAALNRIYALSKVMGKEAAIVEAEKLSLQNSRYYFALLGELYKGVDLARSRENFTRALSMTSNTWERDAIKQKLAST